MFNEELRQIVLDYCWTDGPEEPSKLNDFNLDLLGSEISSLISTEDLALLIVNYMEKEGYIYMSHIDTGSYHMTAKGVEAYVPKNSEGERVVPNAGALGNHFAESKGFKVGFSSETVDDN